MGLIAMLTATIIIILILVFGNSPLSPFTKSSPDNPKTIRDKAQDAVDTTNESTKVQQDQIKDLDLP